MQKKKMTNPLSYCLKCPQKVHCCKFKGKNGFVFVTPNDAQRIKEVAKIDYKDFLEWKRFLLSTIKTMKNDVYYSESALRLSQLKGNKLLVLKKQKNSDCIFLKRGKCSIYSTRPNICKMYPLWFFQGERLHIIAHDEHCKCALLRQDHGKAMLSKKEEVVLQKIAQNILKENKQYKNNILAFIKESSL